LGYVGIVTGLVTMLAVFLICVMFMYRTPETQETGQPGSRDKRPDTSAADTQQAA
jgi:hypothetical protein